MGKPHGTAAMVSTFYLFWLLCNEDNCKRKHLQVIFRDVGKLHLVAKEMSIEIDHFNILGNGYKTLI